MATVTLHSSGAETQSGTGTSILIPFNSLVGMFTNISDHSGTLPTLVVKLQHTPNGTDWYDVSGITTNSLNATGLFSLAPAATAQRVADNVRCVWTIGGVNPSFTFDVELVIVA